MLIFTNGVFDLLTAAHVRFLEAAKGLGDCLIVGLNTDKSIRHIKGDLRPIVPYKQRETVLRALRSVDSVIPLYENEPSALIRHLRPDIVTKAKGYSRENMPEWEAIEEVGAKVIFLPTFDGFSTTEIVEKIIQEHISYRLSEWKKE